jgi:hypothetical protein
MKPLWIVSFLGLLGFSNCFRADGEIVQITCKAVNGLDQPIPNVTIFLVSSDSFLPVNLRTEQQLQTDSQGKVAFTFTYQSKLHWYLQGEAQGAMQPVDMPQISQVKYPATTQFVIPYDSLVPIRIRFKNTIPNMRRGVVEVGHSMGHTPFRADFPITSNSLDTLFQAQGYSQLEIGIWGGVTIRDSFYPKAIRLPKGAKRDSLFTLSLQ